MKNSQVSTLILLFCMVPIILSAGQKRSQGPLGGSRALKRVRQLSPEDQQRLHGELRNVIQSVTVDAGQRENILARAQELMGYGADINHCFRQNNDRLTMLIRAVEGLDIERVRLLLSLGADPNRCGQGSERNSSTPRMIFPLHLVMLRSDFSTNQQADAIARLLINAGANKDFCNSEGQSIFHLIPQQHFYIDGTEDRYLDTVLQILGTEQNINCKDRHGQTPLMLSASYEAVSFAQKLIAAGADVGATDHAGNNVLHYQARSYHGFLDNLEDAIERCGGNTEGFSDFENAWDDAESCLEEVDGLIDKVLKKNSALLEQKNIRGETPLFVALATGEWSLNIYKLFMCLLPPKRQGRKTVLGESYELLCGAARKNKEVLWHEGCVEFDEENLLTSKCKLAQLLTSFTPSWLQWRKKRAVRCRAEVKDFFVGAYGDKEPEQMHYLPEPLAEIILKQAAQFEPELYKATYELPRV